MKKLKTNFAIVVFLHTSPEINIVVLALLVVNECESIVNDLGTTLTGQNVRDSHRETIDQYLDEKYLRSKAFK